MQILKKLLLLVLILDAVVSQAASESKSSSSSSSSGLPSPARPRFWGDRDTVETGKVFKIMKIESAAKGNLRTYLGASWAPDTDEIITQIIPLKYIDSKQTQSMLSKILSSNSMRAYEPTNTLVISDSGYKIRLVLEILELLDVPTGQPKVLIVPIKHSDPRIIVDNINEILKKTVKKPITSFRVLASECSRSVIIIGSRRTVDDIRILVRTFDFPIAAN